MITRRTFSLGAIGTAAALASATGLASTRKLGEPRVTTDPFPLGVASGDPTTSGFVIWTRLVAPALDDRPIEVSWEVAEDERFRRIVRSGQTRCDSTLAHAVHVEVDNLRAGRPYWYRFRALGAASRTGRALTFAPSAARARFALASCQNWEHGYFTAYRDIVASDVDFILHVGDYIYERTWGTPPYVRPHGLPEAADLASYRQRYALYRTDPQLQDAHAAVPFVVTWDDHEVSNDYAGDIGVTGQSPEEFARRRHAAYQAYFEHMPVRPSIWRQGGGARMYRHLAVGDLLSLHILDARQYRDVQACGSESQRGGRLVRECAATRNPARTLLGKQQEAWLYDALRRERAHWTTIAQQMLFAKLDLSAGEPEAVWSDFWDGYSANRERLVRALATPAVRNAVVLGGDIHSCWVSDIKSDYARPESATVGSEFITTCLASRNHTMKELDMSLDESPHVQFMNNETSGYTLCDVDRHRWDVQLRGVESLADPGSRCRTVARFIVADKRPGPRAA